MGSGENRPSNPELEPDNLHRFAVPVAAQFEHVSAALKILVHKGSSHCQKPRV